MIRILFLTYLRHAVSIAVYRCPYWPGFCRLVHSSSCVCFSTRFLSIKCWLDGFFLWSCFDLHYIEQHLKWLNSIEVLFQHLFVENMSAIPRVPRSYCCVFASLGRLMSTKSFSSSLLSREQQPVCTGYIKKSCHSLQVTIPDRKASISDGVRFLCLWCLIKLYTDANLFVVSPWEVEPNQCTEAGQVVYGILIYYLCAACPKHFVHRATTAITAQAT